MNKLVYKLTTAVSTAALLTGSVASVAFGTTTVTISGNGADSDNDANVTVNTSKSIYQTNTADIDNDVNISANTGNNEAEDNTGGDVAISTGDANVSSSVSNSANSNVASLDCGSCPGDLSVKVSGNGSDSDNKADVDVNNSLVVTQANYANIDNDVDVDANTGDNEAKDNTGGEVEIETGDAKVEVMVENMANQNVANIGGGDGGEVDVEISGNGSDSDNDVYLDLNNNVEVFQNNVADIDNDVDVDANSGNNEAEDNTGGDVAIDTGDAEVSVGVDNKANSNALNLDECCELDLGIKVAGNGSDSDNKADVEINSTLAAVQDNNFDCDGGQEYSIFSNYHKGGNCNDIEVDSNTGDNKAEDNTVGDDEDPAIETGDAGADVEVSTEANSNVLGDMDGLNLPDLPDMEDFNGWLMMFLWGHSSN